MRAYGKETEFLPTIMKYFYGIFTVSIGGGICKFLDTFCWVRIGANLSKNLKKDLFVSMMKSEVAFFDTTPIGGILTVISEDVTNVQNAFGTSERCSGAKFGNIYFWNFSEFCLLLGNGINCFGDCSSSIYYSDDFDSYSCSSCKTEIPICKSINDNCRRNFKFNTNSPWI
jgi:ABC-type multidrug transport system fused ATPase/permease subunit